MSDEINALNTNQEVPKGTFASYVMGYILSLILTLVAYSLVVYKIFSTQLLIAALLAIAVIQLYFQLTFFLHIYQEAKPRWNLFILLMTISFITVIVIGSIWIMGNLNYRHDSRTTIDQFLKNEGLGR